MRKSVVVIGGLLIVGITAVIVVAATDAPRRLASYLFGPPAVQLVEAYDRQPAGPTFDHSTFDSLLKAHVREGGWVDYASLAGDAGEKLRAYLEALADAPFDSMGRDDKLALLINAYNAFTLQLIVEHPGVESIRDIPEKKRWDDRRWKIGGHVWSLDQIEHEQIRPRFKEPRVHFALVCAAIGCPPLRREAYVGERIDEQLRRQAEYVHSDGRWFRLDDDVLHLTELYSWYKDDFEQVGRSVLDYAAQYSPGLAERLRQDRAPQIRWIDYDWRLNDVANRPGA